jgi:CHAT domain-containing protein
MPARDEAVLSYFWLDPARLVVVLIRPDEVWHEIRMVDPADRARIEDVTTGASVIGGDPKVLARVRALGPLLLPPGGAVDGVTRLYVSPHRLLHALPFGALELGGRTVLEAMSVVIAPSLTLLGQPRAAPVTGFLAGVDIAEFSAYPGLRSLDLVTGPARAAYADWQAVDRLGPTLSDRQASVAAVLDRAGDLARAGVLQLVTHGTNPRPQEAVDARLALADGALDDLDLVMWPFDGALVIMFACYSGQRALRGESGAELVADEINGLSAALFAAGAGSVIGSLWPAEEPFAAALIEPLHRHLLAGRPVDQALRAAVGEVRATRALFRRTYYWAPYVLSTTTLLPREGHP